MNRKKSIISYAYRFMLVVIFVTTSVSCANAGLVSWFLKNFSDDVAKGVVKNYGDDVAKGIVKNYGDDVAKGIVKNYGDDVAKGVVKNYGDDVAKGVVKNYGDDVAKGVAKNYGDDVVKGLAQNYGDDVAKTVATTYGDDVMRYATKEGAKHVTNWSGIFAGVGRVAMPVAVAAGVYKIFGHVSSVIAEPIAKVMNVSADAVAQKIEPFVNFLLIFFVIYLVVKSILGLFHKYRIYKIKEAKLTKGNEQGKEAASQVEKQEEQRK